MLALDKDWTVTFDPKWGGLEKPVAFSTLDDWSKLEIKVANLWSNRLIRDYGLPKEKRVSQLTDTGTKFYKPDSPLLTSGLLGPVRILSEH